MLSGETQRDWLLQSNILSINPLSNGRIFLCKKILCLKKYFVKIPSYCEFLFDSFCFSYSIITSIFLLYFMYDIFLLDTSVKSYHIDGHAVRNLRKEHKIWFNDFCFRASISSRTLARIESSASTIIRADTMRSLLIGFNLTSQGVRKRPVRQSDFVRGTYRIRHPSLVLNQSPSRKMTVYVNREVRTSISTYAKSHGLSENQALVSIAREHLGIGTDSLKYFRKM